MKNKSLFIDFDGTICFDWFWKSASKDVFDAVQSCLFKNNDRLLDDWMRGKYSVEEVVKLISIGTSFNCENLLDCFVHDCQTACIDSDILLAIEECRAGYNTILITDNMDSFNRFTKPALQLENYFDFIFNSYDFGALKSDAVDDGLFKRVVDMYGFDITASIFLDDSVVNCDIFSEIGGKSILVNGKEDTLSVLRRLVRNG